MSKNVPPAGRAAILAIACGTASGIALDFSLYFALLDSASGATGAWTTCLVLLAVAVGATLGGIFAAIKAWPTSTALAAVCIPCIAFLVAVVGWLLLEVTLV